MGALKFTTHMPLRKVESEALSAAEQARWLIARQRLAVVIKFHELRIKGIDYVAAAREAGTSPASISRWSAALSAHDVDGLLPGTDRCGRTPDLTKLRVPKSVLRQVERLALRYGCGIAAAWRKFARTKNCTPALARRIRQGIPPSFTKATALRTVRVRVGKHISARESIDAALTTQKTK